MAHEVKNSLTPIRLTMEELAARHASRLSPGDRAFFDQAVQIIIDEVNRLERQVRAFSELAAEPPVHVSALDVNAVVEERIGFLRSAHPEIAYDLRLSEEHPRALGDEDLLRGILTNLIENAAEAAGPGGSVRVITAADGDRVGIDVHDSGPGLTPEVRGALFQPTISRKPGGMGLGLSIAHKSAVLSGVEIDVVQGELGGAAFRLWLGKAGGAVTAASGEEGPSWVRSGS
jgi:nitrogen fixation/metabolism regulation signal transduction histidine kinase